MRILTHLLIHFNSYSHDINSTYEFDKESISFLDLKVISSNSKMMISLYIVNLLIAIKTPSLQIKSSGTY